MVGEVLTKLFLARNLCPVCEEREFEGKLPICNQCRDSLTGSGFDLETTIGIQGKIRAFAEYKGIWGKTIKAVKFKGVQPLAPLLGRIISGDLRGFIERMDPDVVTYVPVHPFRWYRRGFDQNREILKGAGIPFIKFLRRIKHTIPFAGLSREERLRKVKKAFAVMKDVEIKGKSVVVFDDVITTGATAFEVTRALKEAGFKEVHFYFLTIEY